MKLNVHALGFLPHHLQFVMQSEICLISISGLTVTWKSLSVYAVVFYCNIRPSHSGNERLSEINYSWQHTPTLLWYKKPCSQLCKSQALFHITVHRINTRNILWNELKLTPNSCYHNCHIISRFHCAVDENCEPLGYYALRCGNSLLMVRDNPLVPSWHYNKRSSVVLNCR
jgi:hypothetical protein